MCVCCFLNELHRWLIVVLLQAEDIVTKVTIQMLETTEDWKYDGCSCGAKLILTEGDQLRCKKCPGVILNKEPKYLQTSYTIRMKTNAESN